MISILKFSQNYFYEFILWSHFVFFFFCIRYYWIYPYLIISDCCEKESYFEQFLALY